MNRLTIATIFLWAAAPFCAAAPIVGVRASATSAQVEKLFDPQNLCNDAGLTDAGKGDGSLKLTTNGYTDGGCMWHSGYLAHGGDENPTIQFDLGKSYLVDRFHIWNHNSNPSRGFKHVSVLISDDAKTWRPSAQRFQFAKAPHSEDYIGEKHQFIPAVKARYIRFVCETTHREGGNRELAGLGKVRFYEALDKAEPKPEPRIVAGALPDGAGAINVREHPYRAKGDGISDDTAAIQQAIDDWQGTRRTILLPAGTYRITAPLRYKAAKGFGYNNLRGAGLATTTLRLDDNTFTDTAKALPVLTLGFNGREDGKGVHADWFNNNVADLTIDTGNGNSGAIGLQFYSNNVGSLRNVEIRSADGKGHIGLDLGYADQNGPCLIKHITIRGFATGIRTGATVNSQTLEHITVTHATKIGWENGGQCLAIRGLKLVSSGEGFVNKFGIVALIDAQLTGSGAASGHPAIVNHETLFARNIRTNGFHSAIDNRRPKDGPTASADGPDVDEWVSTAPLSLFPNAKPRSLNLPVKETPELDPEAPASWANIRAFRWLDDPDDSKSLQRAIDSGATTIYFPAGGHFFFGEPVELRGKVKRIVGMYAGVHGIKGPARWRIAAEGSPTLFIEDLIGEAEIDHAAAKRTLVVKNGQGIGGHLTGGGELFIENVVADWNFNNGRAWARQFNNEKLGTHITNAGATLWILGLKTERGGTLIETKAGGATELLGGLSYTTNHGKLAPMFVSTDARVSYVIGEVCYTGDPFSRLVHEQRGDQTKLLERGKTPLRPAFLQGSEIPLYVGEP